jgi:hypothetical protein
LSLPSAGDPGSELAFTETPFIEALDADGLPIAFPSSLSEIAGGIATLNGQLQRHRAAPAAVRPPAVTDRRARYHGGALHPGEPSPRTIPDNHSLRLRMLTHCPVLSLLGALLVMDRRSDLPLQIVDRGAGPLLRWGRHTERDLVEALDAFAASQGWLCSRPLRGGLDSGTLEAIAREVGLSTRAGRRVVMEEGLFVRLQEDIEARLTYDALQPLVRRLHGWLDGQTPTDLDDTATPPRPV